MITSGLFYHAGVHAILFYGYTPWVFTASVIFYLEEAYTKINIEITHIIPRRSGYIVWI